MCFCSLGHAGVVRLLRAGVCWLGCVGVLVPGCVAYLQGGLVLSLGAYQHPLVRLKTEEVCVLVRVFVGVSCAILLF